MNMQTRPALATANATVITMPAHRPGKLASLIQKWQNAYDALAAAGNEHARAYDAAEAAMPPPDATITNADPLLAEAKDYDFRIKGAVWSGFLETALTYFDPCNVIERDTPDGHAFVILTDRLPLTPERLEIKAQLQARVETARAYERLFKKTKLANGVDPNHDDVVARYSATMLRLEQKIAAYRCRTADDLRAKISFTLQLLDNNDGLEYFDGPEMIETILRDTLAKLVA